MTAIQLTPAQRKEKRAEAHHLDPVVMIGNDGLTPAIRKEADAAPIQHIGKLLVFWRPIPPKERVEREDRKPGPRVVKILKFSKSGNHRAQVKKVTVLGNMRLAAGGELKRAKKRVSSVKKSQKA